MPARGRRAGPARRRRSRAGRSSASATSRPAGRSRRGSGPGPGLGVRRTALHAALAARADEVGRRAGDRARSARSSRTPRASRRPGCGPGGWWPPTACTRRYAGSSGCSRPAPGRPGTGCAGTSRSRRGSEHVEVHWGDRAEAYVTPVSERPGGRGVPRRPRRRRPTTSCWPASRRCARGCAAPSRPPTCAGAGPLRQSARTPRSGRVLLVGDAAGYVDALTGEGVAVGLATARAAVARSSPAGRRTTRPPGAGRPGGTGGPRRPCSAVAARPGPAAAGWSRPPARCPQSSPGPSTRWPDGADVCTARPTTAGTCRRSVTPWTGAVQCGDARRRAGRVGRRRTAARRPPARPALLREIVLLVTLFLAYRLGRLAITGHDDLAIANAWRVWDVERLLRAARRGDPAGLGPAVAGPAQGRELVLRRRPLPGDARPSWPGAGCAVRRRSTAGPAA